MELLERDLTQSVIGGFYEVYDALGHGFLERIYQAALEEELRWRGLRVERQVPVMVCYKGTQLGMQRVDMIVERVLVVEIKASRDLPSTACRQLLNYLKATRLEVGLLFHFGIRPDFERVVRSNPR